MKHKLISLLLALALLLSCLPVGTFAAEQETVPSQTGSASHVNPVYANVFTQDEISASGGETPPNASYASVNYHTSKTSFYKAVRTAMENRDTYFTVGIKLSAGSFSASVADALFYDSLDYAFAHTGVPTQGDYIYFNYAGCSASWEWEYSGSSVYTVYYYSVNYNSSASQEATMDSRVDSLLSQLGTSGSNYQKIKRVYDWMCANIRYDYDNLNNSSYRLKYSAYAALVNRTAVCQGYATLLYRLALEMGVDCRLVCSIDSENHVWNIVSMGSRYYNADATWDEGNAYYEWFLRSDADFPRHTRSSKYASSSFYNSYPMGAYSYDPNTAATIITQPKNASAVNGKTVTVTVQASGSGLTYKWYYKEPGGSKFYQTNAFTGNTYSVPMNEARDGRKIYCRITDRYGNTVQTNTVTLSMTKQTAKITSQPKSVTVAKGATAKVTVKATGDGLSYRWYYKDAGASKYTYTSSFKGSSYSVTMNEARNGRRVLCRVYDKYGNVVQSDSALLKMQQAVKITSQPKSVTATEGGTVKVTVKATGDGLTYRWYYKDAGSSDYTYTSTFKGNTYSTTMNAARNGRRVLCKVSDKYGNTVTSESAVLKMAEGVKITSQPKSVTAAEGTTVKITVKATGEGLTYRWYYKDVGASDYTYTSSFKGNTYSVKLTSARDGRRVLCRVTDKYGNTVQSKSAVMNIK